MLILAVFFLNFGSEYVKLILTNYIHVQVCCELYKGNLDQTVNSSLLIVSFSKYCVSPLRLSFGNCAKSNIIINLNVIIIANPELLIHTVLVFLYHLKYPFVLHLILYITNLQKYFRMWYNEELWLFGHNHHQRRKSPKPWSFMHVFKEFTQTLFPVSVLLIAIPVILLIDSDTANW